MNTQKCKKIVREQGKEAEKGRGGDRKQRAVARSAAARVQSCFTQNGMKLVSRRIRRMRRNFCCTQNPQNEKEFLLHAESAELKEFVSRRIRRMRRNFGE